MNIDSFAEVISACRFCFMCRHLSAVGQAGCREADTPRGRALIADTVRMHPEKISDADFVDAVYRSDLSGANRFHCDGAMTAEGTTKSAFSWRSGATSSKPEPSRSV